MKSLNSCGGGTSQHLLHTTSHTQPRLSHAYLCNFGDCLAFAYTPSLQGESEDQKDFTETHKFPVELGGNSHPQGRPSHVTSPREEVQAPRAGRRDHLASSSPLHCRGRSLHPLQLCLPPAHVSVRLGGKPQHDPEPDHSLRFHSRWLRFQTDQFLRHSAQFYANSRERIGMCR